MELTITRATGADAEALGLVHAASWQEGYKGIVPEEFLRLFTPAARAEAFRQALPGAKEEYYLLRADDAPAGLAIVSASHDEDAPPSVGELCAVYLHPDYWGTGASAALLGFCLDRLRAMGYASATLWVLEKNARARAFYEKNGFAPDGAEKTIDIRGPLVELRYTALLVSPSPAARGT